jgi:hypothetical protein
MKTPRPTKRALAGLALAAWTAAAAGCGQWTFTQPPARTAEAQKCVPSSEVQSTQIGARHTVRVGVGRVITLSLIEPEIYASSSTSAPPPTAFPWLRTTSSNPAGLAPAAVCRRPRIITSIPARYYPFRAMHPGQYVLTSRLNPAYHLPRMRPPLKPLRPVSVTVIVGK